MIFTIPTPPSTNTLFFNRKHGKGRGRIPTPEYSAWQDEAGWLLKAQNVKSIAGRVRVDMVIGEGRFDGDNAIKPTLDLLVKMGIIQGDSPKYMRGGSWILSKDIDGIQVRITSMAELG